MNEREGVLDWSEHEAPPAYDDYFAARGIELAEGQFADVSLEWEAYHADVARFLQRGLIVTIDYGYPANKLFHPRARRFGTAAAYAGQRVSRDLLANPGEQDLTAHINFTDLERAGERHGATLSSSIASRSSSSRLGITEHELFRPVHDLSIDNPEQGMELMEAREEARRLVLPDGIGEEMRVLVQAKNVELDGLVVSADVVLRLKRFRVLLHYSIGDPMRSASRWLPILTVAVLLGRVLSPCRRNRRPAR